MQDRLGVLPNEARHDRLSNGSRDCASVSFQVWPACRRLAPRGRAGAQLPVAAAVQRGGSRDVAGAGRADGDGDVRRKGLSTIACHHHHPPLSLPAPPHPSVSPRCAPSHICQRGSGAVGERVLRPIRGSGAGGGTPWKGAFGRSARPGGQPVQAGHPHNGRQHPTVTSAGSCGEFEAF